MPFVGRQSKRPKSSDSDNSSDSSENGLSGPTTTRLERCRMLAKTRRDAEQEEYKHLAEVLPFPRDVVARLDKSSLLRLAICYLQMKNFTHQKEINPDVWVDEAVEEGALMLDVMEGFLMFVDNKGSALYVSEQVEQHLGIAQVDLVGNPIMGYIHPRDRQEFVKQFLDRSAYIPSQIPVTDNLELALTEDFADGFSDVTERERMFYVRMKTFYVRPGTKTKVTQYVLTQWTGRLQLREDGCGNLSVHGLLAIIRPIHTTPIIEIRLDGSVFISRHDLDLRYTFCDPRVLNLLGYEPSELLGKTCFTFHNPLDQHKVVACHSDLISKGTAVSKCYRFLGKNGSWVWMQTRATIIYSASDEPQYVVCQNYIQKGAYAVECEEEELREQGQQSVVPAFIDLTYMSGLPGGARDCIPDEDDATNGSHGSSQEGSTSQGAPKIKGLSTAKTVHSNLFLTSPIAPLPPGVVPANQSLQNGSLAAMAIMKKASSGSLKSSKGSLGSLMDFNTDDIYLSEEALDLGEASMQWFTGSELERLAEEAAASVVSTEGASNIVVSANGDSATHTTLAAAVSDHAYSAKPRDSPSPSCGRNEKPMSRDSSNNSVQMSSSGFLPGLANSSSGSDVEMLEDAFLGVPVSQPPLQHLSSSANSTMSGSTAQASDSILVSLLGETDKKKGRKLASQSTLKPTAHTRSPSSSAPSRPTTMRVSVHTVPSNLFNLGLEPSVGNIPESDGDIIQKLADALVAQQAQENMSHFSGQMAQTDSSDLFANMPVSSITTQGSFAPSETNIGAELFPSLNDGSNLFSSYNAPISSAVPFSSYQPTSSQSTGIQDSRPSQSQAQSQPHAYQSMSWSSRKNPPPSLQAYRNPSGMTSPTETPTPTKTGTSLLEKFLTTDKPLNPNKGSDTAFSENVTAQISQLNIAEGDTNLLKQLLTGEIDGQKVQQFEQSVIQTRKYKEDSPTPTPQVQMTMDAPLSLPALQAPRSDQQQADLGAGIELFGAETAGDLENIWGSISSSDMEMLMHSDLDDILREQMRQEDLWLREYFDDI